MIGYKSENNSRETDFIKQIILASYKQIIFQVLYRLHGDGVLPLFQ